MNTMRLRFVEILSFGLFSIFVLKQYTQPTISCQDTLRDNLFTNGKVKMNGYENYLAAWGKCDL